MIIGPRGDRDPLAYYKANFVSTFLTDGHKFFAHLLFSFEFVAACGWAILFCEKISEDTELLCAFVSLNLGQVLWVVFTELLSQKDQEITELVSEQQKVDAELAHVKSELEQLKLDISNANKQKMLITKATENKV